MPLPVRPRLSPFLTLLLAACGTPDREFGSGEPVDPESGTMAIGADLLVVSLDTTSVEAIDAWMPNTRDWLDGSLQYTEAHSPANSTVESTASVFMDAWVQRQIVVSEQRAALPLDLDAAGYHTLLVSANPALDQPFFREGFDQSVVRELGTPDDFPDGTAISTFLSAWNEMPSPKMGWLQIVVGHDYRTRLPGLNPTGIAQTDAELALAWQSYGTDAAETDAILPEVFAANPDGLTVLTGDHGEMFGDRASSVVPGIPVHGHGLSTSRYETHVALALAGPGIQPAISAQPVSTLDLHPTLLRVSGALDDGPDLLSGTDLRPAAVSVCFVGDDRDASHWMASVVRPDGTQVLHTSGNQGLPEWLV